MCRTALEQDGGAGLTLGFNLSIVLLVSLPLLMAGTFLWMLRRAARRAGPDPLVPEGGAGPPTRGS
jgi:hypothetical protein